MFLYSKNLANFEAFGWVISLSIKLNEECKGGYRVSEKIKAAATIPESTRCAFVLVEAVLRKKKFLPKLKLIFEAF